VERNESSYAQKQKKEIMRERKGFKYTFSALKSHPLSVLGEKK